ncbi:uncharacterized protein LOC144922954 [Branchiostoma floridae x Branchiostoma belcheri]
MMADLERQKQEQLTLMQQLEQQRRQLLDQLEQERAAHEQRQQFLEQNLLQRQENERATMIGQTEDAKPFSIGQRQQFLERNLLQHQENERTASIGQKPDATPFAIGQVPISHETAIGHPTASVDETKRTIGRQPVVPDERQSVIGPQPPQIDDQLITIRRHQKKLLEQYRARQESVRKVQQKLEQHSQRQPGRTAQMHATNRDVVVPKLEPWASSMAVPQSRLRKDPTEATQASAIRQPQLVDSGVRGEGKTPLQPGGPTVPSTTGVPGSLDSQKARELEDIQRRKEELIRQQEMVRKQKEEMLAHQRKQEEEMRMRQQWLEQQMEEQQRQLEEQQQLYILQQQAQHEASTSVEEDSNTVPKEGYEREVLPEFLEADSEVSNATEDLMVEPIRKTVLPPKPPPAWSRQVHYFRGGPTHELSTIQEVDTPGSERMARSMALAQELDDTMRSAHQDDLGSMSLDLEGSMTQSQRRTWHDLLLSPPEVTQPRSIATMTTDDVSRATTPPISSTHGALATASGIETVVSAATLQPVVSSAVTPSTLSYSRALPTTGQPGIASLRAGNVPSFAADVGRGVLGYSSVRQPVQLTTTTTSQPTTTGLSIATSTAPVPSSQPTLSMEGTKYSDLAQRLSQLIDDKLSLPSSSRSSAPQPLGSVFSPLASQPRTMSQARIDQSRSLFSSLATQSFFPTVDAVSSSSEGLDVSDIGNPNFPHYSVKPLSLQEASFAPLQKLEESGEIKTSAGGGVEDYSQEARGSQSEDSSSAVSMVSTEGSEQGGPLLTQRSLNSFSSVSDDFRPLKPAHDPTLESLPDHTQVEKPPQMQQFQSPGSFVPLKPSSDVTLDSTHLSDFSSIRGSPVKGQRFPGLTSWSKGIGQGSNVMTSSPLKTMRTPGGGSGGFISSQQLRDDVQAMRERHRREREILLEGALSHLEREDFGPALPKEERGILEESDLTLVESTLIEGPIADDKDNTLREEGKKREDSGSSLVEGRLGDTDTLQEEVEHSDDQSPSLMSFEQHEWSVSLESSLNSGEQAEARGPTQTGLQQSEMSPDPAGTSQQRAGTTDDTMDSLRRALSAWKDSRRF